MTPNSPPKTRRSMTKPVRVKKIGKTSEPPSKEEEVSLQQRAAEDMSKFLSWYYKTPEVQAVIQKMRKGVKLEGSHSHAVTWLRDISS